ncbi:MAG TPA: GNAT family N-acetyltransferase [Mycobacteriales bacterium]|jgi:CelD/BcsL family acetyltransferase involved in cellulose biosynthesis|nr:GNAT family N-acetyltransferase [Mycobacteriales bacterium]
MRRSVTVCCVTELAELREHATAWDALAQQAPERMPMLSHAWVSAFLETRLPPTKVWRCFLAYRSGALVGVLPVVRARSVPRGYWRSPVDSHTSCGHPLLAASSADEALARLLDAVQGVEPGLLGARFYGVRDCSPVLSGSYGEGGLRVSSPRTSRGSFLETSGSYAEFEAGLTRNFRRNLRKAGNRATRDHRVVWESVRGAQAGRPEILQEFLDLESSGWKGDRGTAISNSPALTRFYTVLAARLADRGWLEWQRLTFDGRLVASHLAIRLGRAVVLPKIAHDESHGRLGPGNLLMQETISQAFADDGVDEVNCLTDMPWHRNWEMAQADYRDLLLVPRGPLPLVASARESALPRALARGVVSRFPGLLPTLTRLRHRG